MKLLQKYNRINIVVTIAVLLISSCCYYFIISYILINQLDKNLQEEKEEIVDYITKNNALPDTADFKDEQVSFELANSVNPQPVYKNADVYSKEEKELEPSRQIIFPLVFNGKNYRVSISLSKEETEDLIQMILLITLGVVVLLLISLFIINRFLLNKLWLPFNTTLNALKDFKPAQKNKIQLAETSINEFAELNEAVKIMANRVNYDYENLKTFTENASHEMQTPLAIINSKLDVLIQDDTINASQMLQLHGIYDALSRLSRLTQSLLLLAKIENNQFVEKENILLRDFIIQKLVQFEEIIHAKGITITTALESRLLYANRQLIDILISNLLNNAINYNIENGAILIVMMDTKLSFVNNSSFPALDEEQVFKRFYRPTSSATNGNGLGLSIIKQICDVNGYELSYFFSNQNHEFSIVF